MGFAWNRLAVLILSVTLAGISHLLPPALGESTGAENSAPLPNADLITLKFELLEQHLIVVRGSIGPLDKLKLLIDTGAIPTMVDRRVAKKFALEAQGGESISFGQRSKSPTVVLPSLRLGPLTAGAFTAGVGDLSFLPGVDAVIGLDVLAHSSFSIDYEKRLLTFGPMVVRRPSVQLEATAPFLTVQLTISGRPVHLLVDTGSRRLVLFERRVRDRLPAMQLHGELLMCHLSGTSRLDRVVLPLVAVGGSTLDRVEGFLSNAPVDLYPPGIDGVLGLRALAPKHAHFDFERGQLAFE